MTKDYDKRIASTTTVSFAGDTTVKPMHLIHSRLPRSVPFCRGWASALTYPNNPMRIVAGSVGE
jgi:hypothetical protein